MKNIDVIVVGAGHAGCEAAAAAARVGAKTILVSFSKENIGQLSCNPSIGGIGKGHIVKEIDALDGVMPQVADKACIHFRMLNASRGPAVWGPRMQMDRKLYKQAMSELLFNYPNLEFVEGEVTNLLIEDGVIVGIILNNDIQIKAKAVVLTNGTFLGGKIFVGKENFSAGRWDESPSNKLAEALQLYPFEIGRLKTGTPPRILAKSIDYDKTTIQPSEPPQCFSALSKGVNNKLINCYITHTSKPTHEIIGEYLDTSPIYAGIKSAGPRYCPSIEDKIVRFSDKEAHQIFLEPEGLESDLVYPNGISTGIAKEGQQKFLPTINGLEQAVITQPGYAIEYYYFNPKLLQPTLESRVVKNLFLAGQINGTTGYEEAAGQGLIAGINAAFHAFGSDPFVLSRTESYIGVMIDDLINYGVSEPYRMFTSRAEFRLHLRVDNADLRLTQKGIERNIVSKERADIFLSRFKLIEQLREMLSSVAFTPNLMRQYGIEIGLDGVRRSLLETISTHDVSYAQIVELLPQVSNFPIEIFNSLQFDVRYKIYQKRLAAEINNTDKYSQIVIPEDMDYNQIVSLSNELKQKLVKQQPVNFYQVTKIEGMTPAAMALILNHLQRLKQYA